MRILPAETASTHSLPERLSRLARAVPEGSVLCDVGSDHGLLPLALLKEGVCRKAIVTDLRPMPLKRAERALSAAGLSDRAEFCLCDGIPRKALGEADVFVIAGMGGETIASILENAPGAIPSGTLFRLQPMTHEECLRRTLAQTGFRIDREEICVENGKVFLLLFCTFDGRIREPDETEILFGNKRFSSDPGRGLYYEKKRSALKKQLSGRSSAGLDTAEQIRLLSALDDLLGENYENQ